MSTEKQELAPSKTEDKFLKENLDRERLDGVTEAEIKKRKSDIIASNNAYDTSLVPHLAEGLDISKIIDTSGKSPEIEDITIQEIGSSATMQVVSQPERPADSSTIA